MAEELRAVVICFSEQRRRRKTPNMQEVLQIAHRLVKLREKADSPILDFVYSLRLEAYVAIYERLKSRA